MIGTLAQDRYGYASPCPSGAARPHSLAARANRRVALPDALAAPRREERIEGIGRLSWYGSGSGGGRPLVLVHSINAAPSAYEMKPLFDRYSASRPVYALDLPGFGFSERADRVYTPELFSSAIAELLRREVGQPVDLVALSLGCEFAARVASTAPELVASLVLLSPTGFSSRTMRGGKTGERFHSAVSLPGLGRSLFAMLTVKPSMRYFLNQSFAGSPAPDGMVEYAYATAHQPGAHHAPLYFLSGLLFTQDAPHALYAKLTQPVLVIHDADPNINFRNLQGFLAGRSNWRAERIAPTNGLPHWEKPEETAAAMERFWQENG